MRPWNPLVIRLIATIMALWFFRFTFLLFLFFIYLHDEVSVSRQGEWTTNTHLHKSILFNHHNNARALQYTHYRHLSYQFTWTNSAPTLLPRDNDKRTKLICGHYSRQSPLEYRVWRRMVEIFTPTKYDQLPSPFFFSGWPPRLPLRSLVLVSLSGLSAWNMLMHAVYYRLDALKLFWKSRFFVQLSAGPITAWPTFEMPINIVINDDKQ